MQISALVGTGVVGVSRETCRWSSNTMPEAPRTCI